MIVSRENRNEWKDCEKRNWKTQNFSIKFFALEFFNSSKFYFKKERKERKERKKERIKSLSWFVVWSTNYYYYCKLSLLFDGLLFSFQSKTNEMKRICPSKWNEILKNFGEKRNLWTEKKWQKRKFIDRLKRKEWKKKEKDNDDETTNIISFSKKNFSLFFPIVTSDNFYFFSKLKLKNIWKMDNVCVCEPMCLQNRMLF